MAARNAGAGVLGFRTSGRFHAAAACHESATLHSRKLAPRRHARRDRALRRDFAQPFFAAVEGSDGTLIHGATASVPRRPGFGTSPENWRIARRNRDSMRILRPELFYPRFSTGEADDAQTISRCKQGE